MGDSDQLKRSYSLIPRNRYVAIVAFAVFFLCLVEIVDLFQIPFESSIKGALISGSSISSSILAPMSTYGYAGLFILMVLESASLPVPSEVVLPFAGYLVYIGSMNFMGALMDSTIAGVVGALVDYYLALKLGRPFVERLLKWFRVRPEHLDRAEEWVSSKGSWSILVARFIPGIRSVISIPAGVLEMRMKPFFLMTLVGSFAWSALLIYLGYSAGPLWETALGTMSLLLTQTTLFVVGAASFVYVVYCILPSIRVKKSTPDKTAIEN